MGSFRPSFCVIGQGQASPKMRRKDLLPNKHDVPLMGLKSDRDFIVINALDVIKAVPKRPEPEFFYTEKPDYGQVPEYLLQAKQQQEEALARKAAREQLQIDEVGLAWHRNVSEQAIVAQLLAHLPQRLGCILQMAVVMH